MLLLLLCLFLFLLYFVVVGGGGGVFVVVVVVVVVLGGGGGGRITFRERPDCAAGQVHSVPICRSYESTNGFTLLGKSRFIV